MAYTAGDAGHVAVHNAILAEHAAWTAFTPAFTATTVPPNFGTTPTLSGARLVVGKTQFWRFSVTAGGTGIAAGTGTWLMAWPGALASVAGVVGCGWIYNGSWYNVVADTYSNQYIRFVLTAASPGYMGSTLQPLTAAGHVLQASGVYETV